MDASSPMFIHYVSDMNRAIAFYNGVFALSPSFESPGWSTFEFESFQLALHIHSESDHEEDKIPNAGLNLLVSSIETFADRISAHGGSMRELREPDGFVPVRVASFFDSEGNGFELRQEP